MPNFEGAETREVLHHLPRESGKCVQDALLDLYPIL